MWDVAIALRAAFLFLLMTVIEPEKLEEFLVRILTVPLLCLTHLKALDNFQL